MRFGSIGSTLVSVIMLPQLIKSFEGIDGSPRQACRGCSLMVVVAERFGWAVLCQPLHRACLLFVVVSMFSLFLAPFFSYALYTCVIVSPPVPLVTFTCKNK